MTQEWAIQNEATGEWWDSEDCEWVKSPVKGNVNYHHLAQHAPFCFGHEAFRYTARIVPAPPREMTDAEAEAWFKAKGPRWRISPKSTGGYYCTTDDIPGPCGDGATIYDAIRAAAKK